jgi:general secretion pathway protein E
MGIEPFLLSSSLIGVLAQRLVRRLCQECRRPREATLNEIQSFDLPEDPPPILYQAEGCSKCNNTGYVGRCGIYELIPIDDKIREMIHKGAGEQEMVGHARTYTPSIRQNGRHLVLEGLTTFEEVLRVTREG